MSSQAIIEVAIGLMLLVGGIIVYRKRGKEDPRHGSQSAVLMFVAAAMLLVHGLNLMAYRPSQGELEALQRR